MKVIEVLLKYMDDDRSRDSIIKAMHDYARLQIEKDRERLYDHNADCNDYTISLDVPIILD